MSGWGCLSEILYKLNFSVAVSIFSSSELWRKKTVKNLVDTNLVLEFTGFEVFRDQ
jgi:hypothetical protein